MSERELFFPPLAGWSALAVVVFVALFFVPAPYGRFAGRARAATIPTRWGWLMMETPAALVPLFFYLTGRHRGTLVATVFLALWLSHYVQRAFVFPFLLRGGERRMPVGIVAMAIVFNLINGTFQGRWLFDLAPRYPASWLGDPRFLAGTALFVAGWATNRRADARLRALRAPGAAGESDYAIPRGGLFERISCPNYLGEIVLWIGWALLTGSAVGASFALWTIANLAPAGFRASANASCKMRRPFSGRSAHTVPITSEAPARDAGLGASAG